MLENTNTELKVSENLEQLNQTDIVSLKAQEVSLSLLLLQLAQREAKRISKLAAVIDKLEEHIFDPEIIEHLTASEQIQRYQLATQATTLASSYIQAAVKSVNWNDIETKIMILSQEANDPNAKISDKSKEIESLALKLLNQVGRDGINK